MDVVDLEKEELLASIRLQEEALSVSISGGSNFVATGPYPGEESADETYVSALQDLPENDDCDEADPLENEKPNCADVLAANMEYDESLAKVEQDIRQNIDRIEKDLALVREKIARLKIDGSLAKPKGNWTYVFGSPYFKDATFYPCPKNEDYYKKKKNREILWSELPQFHQWVPKLKRLLVGAIRKLSIEKSETKARVKLAGLRKDLEAARERKDFEQISLLEGIVSKFNIDEEANSMLQDTIENDEHDWMQLSAKYLEGKQSPEGCRSFWMMYMHPKINKGPWTEAEENNLKKLAKKHYAEDWDAIAKELGTDRSGYQCFIVYQTKLNDALKRSTWTKEEDKKLAEVIELCRIGDYIPWGKVAFSMDGRTKAQVFNRWSYSLNPVIKKGRFTNAEDIMILVGVSMWGEDFQRIANFMKDRTTCQVRDRFKNYLGRGDIGIPWTTEDDERIMALVNTYGKNWAKISEHFTSKDRTQVRHRYNTLVKWRESNPGVALQDAPIRRHGPRHTQDFTKQWERARAILSCETVDEMAVEREKFVSTLTKTRKKSIFPTQKKKKMSLVEADMINYFRCTYDVPGGRRIYQLRPGDTDKYSDEIIQLMDIFGVNLKLPCLEEIQADRSLSYADKEILLAVSMKKAAAGVRIKESPPESPIHHFTDEFLNTGGTASYLSDGAEPSTSSGAGTVSSSKIDYVRASTPSSVYIDLPLLNFQNDAIVVDEKEIKEEPAWIPNFMFVDTNDDCLEVENRSSVISQRPEETFVIPPNFSSMVGLRTYLLNRRALADWSNQDRKARKFADAGNDKVKSAFKLFNKRMLSLFLWPALMSRTPPTESQIFFESGEMPPGLGKQNAIDEETSINLNKKRSPATNTDSSNSSPVPSTSKRKRRYQVLCPTSGDFLTVEESSCSSGEDNSGDALFNASNESEVIDISDDNSSELPLTMKKKMRFCDLPEDSSTDVQFCEADDSNDVQFSEISRNSPVELDTPSFSAHENFISGPDISLASAQNSGNPVFQVVEVLEELVKPNLNARRQVISMGRLCQYTGRLIPKCKIPIAYEGENPDEDPDDVVSVDL